MSRWLPLGGTVVAILGIGALAVGFSRGLWQPSPSGGGGPEGVSPSAAMNENELHAAERPAAPGDTLSAAPLRPAARTYLVMPGCCLVPEDTQEVPSQRDGQLLIIGRELEPGEPLPPEDRRVTAIVGFAGIEVQPGEQVPANQLVPVTAGRETRRYRPLKEDDPLDPEKLWVGRVVKHFHRLRENDPVKKGQLLALVDASLAVDDFAIKCARLVASEFDLRAVSAIRAEAEQRLLTSEQLYSRKAISLEDYRMAQLSVERYHSEEVSKRQAIQLTRRELSQARTVLTLYEIRSKIDGVIRHISRKPGEAVKNLEPVFQVHNPRRLRIEGKSELQYLALLQEMKAKGRKLVVEPTRPVPPRQELSGHLLEVTAVAVSKDPENPLIISGSEDGTVRVWESASGRERAILRHPAPVRAVACTPPGAEVNLCLSGAADGSGRLWDLDRDGGPLLRELAERHKGPINAVAFSPDGKWCVTGGEDRSIYLWDADTGKLRYSFLPTHRARITSLQFTHGPRLVSAGADNTLLFWTVGDQGARLEATRFDRRSGDIGVPGVSADGRRVLFDMGKELRVVSLPEGWTDGILQNPPGAARFTTFALFSPDGRLILTAIDAEGLLQIWRAPTDTARPHEMRQLVWKGAPATCGAFAPDGSFVVTGMKDRQVLVWPVPGREEIAHQLEAEITLVEPAVDPKSRQLRLWAEIENSNGRLTPGAPVTLVVYPR